MYGTHDGSFFNDDAKSYSTYEKGLDEDYAKHYDDDEDDDTDHVKKGSKGTYLTDDPSPIRQSPPWSKMEGSYSVCITALSKNINAADGLHIMICTTTTKNFKF